MLRLLTFCLLLAVATAQNGYEYNKPGKSFGADSTPNRPGYAGGSGFPSSPGAASYPNGAPGSRYPTTGSGVTPVSGPTGYPAGTSQDFTSPGHQRPQSGYPPQSTSNSPYPNQGTTGQAGASFPGSSNYPGQQGANNIPGQDSNYPGQPESGSNYPSGGQNYPGQSNQPGSPNQQGPTDNTGAYENGDYSAIPGEPDVDYPILTEIPQTSFRCDAQEYPGYYADVETRCQVFHVCANNRTFNFLCPNGTIFSQQVFVCVWWNQFDCASAPGLYGLNANLYDYSITGSQEGGSNDYSQAPQGASAYPGNAGSQGVGSINGFPSNSGTQTPSGGYPDNSRPQTYPGSPNLIGSDNYPGKTPQGPLGPSSQISSNYPVTDNSQGYPSGKPNGPSFPTGGSQNDVGFVQQPNREYLPPRN